MAVRAQNISNEIPTTVYYTSIRNYLKKTAFSYPCAISEHGSSDRQAYQHDYVIYPVLASN